MSGWRGFDRPWQAWDFPEGRLSRFCSARQVLLTYALQVCKGRERFRSLSRDVKPQVPYLRRSFWLRCFPSSRSCRHLPPSARRTAGGPFLLALRLLDAGALSAPGFSPCWAIFFISSSSASMPARIAAICASARSRLRSSSRRLRSSSSFASASAIRSFASWAARAEPVSTPAGARDRRPQADAVVGEKEFANLVRVGHAPGLEDHETPVALASLSMSREDHPGVHQRGDAHFRLFEALPPPL